MVISFRTTTMAVPPASAPNPAMAFSAPLAPIARWPPIPCASQVLPSVPPGLSANLTWSTLIPAMWEPHSQTPPPVRWCTALRIVKAAVSSPRPSSNPNQSRYPSRVVPWATGLCAQSSTSAPNSIGKRRMCAVQCRRSQIQLRRDRISKPVSYPLKICIESLSKQDLISL